MRPLFTIATITYNSGKWARQAIESVLASSYTDFEFIISDDFSSDDTWSIVQEYDDPRIKASQNKPNLGEYSNRNKVLDAATGQFIFFIDGDDILYKDTLQMLQRLIKAFPTAGMIWGVPVNDIDFAVLPCLLTPRQIIQIMFFTPLSIASIGLAETVFSVDALRSIGGFSTEFAIGDTYIKRKLAVTTPVLLTPTGFSFWRRSGNQASQRASRKYRSFIDLHQINQSVLNDPTLPLNETETQQAVLNTRISEIKLMVSNTLLKGRLSDFFLLMKKLDVSFSELLLLLQKGKFDYKIVADISDPLMNNYHFMSSKDEVVNATISSH